MSAFDSLGQRRKSQEVWLPELVQHIASFLPDNEIVCTLRLVSKATSKLFSSYTCVKLSLPCPEYAFAARWGVTGALHALTFKQRRQLLTLTAASGVMTNLKVAFVAIAATLTDEALQLNSVAPRQLCPWLRVRGCWWLDEVLAAAAQAGHQAVCEWLLACGCPFTKWDVIAAARGGHLGLMEWLVGQEPGLREDLDAAKELLIAAAEGCSLGDLQRLYGEWAQPHQITDRDKELILAAAASSPTSDWQAKVEWLEAQGYPRDTTQPGCQVAAAAAHSDSVSRLVWLRERGYPIEGESLSSAAGAGNMAALEFVLNTVARTSLADWAYVHALDEAAHGGHVAALEALYAQGRIEMQNEIDAYALLKNAALSGRLAVVVWVVETFRVPSSELQRSMVSAVMALRSGSLEVVRWLMGRGCRLEEHMVWDAARSGCGALLEWLIEELGGPGQSCSPYRAAISFCDVATLRLLGRLGVPMENGDHVYGLAAQVRDVSVLRCLWEQLCYPFSPTTETFVKWVRKGSSLACLRWLTEELGCPVDFERALEAVERRPAKPGHEDLRQWLLANQQ